MVNNALLLRSCLGLDTSLLLTLDWELLDTGLHLDARKKEGSEIDSLTGCDFPGTAEGGGVTCDGWLDAWTTGVTGISTASPLYDVHLLPFHVPCAPQIQLRISR